MSKDPTRTQAMLAKCHDCTGHYHDGKDDCEVTKCPLYKWMPYRKLEPDFEWAEYNPRSKGLVSKEETKRDFTPEQKEAMVKRLEAARERRYHADLQDSGVEDNE
ncbi:MAG: hypothetical protein DRP83_00210 [Planctomycetota bacterium]|nr:MAG: hypothetical protein DRP83_00210 [Planctomycetota bacterium]